MQTYLLSLRVRTKRTVDDMNEEQRVTEDLSGDHVDPFLPWAAHPTLHEVESRASAAGWQKIRKEIIDAVTENEVMPVRQVCSKFLALFCCSKRQLYLSLS